MAKKKVKRVKKKNILILFIILIIISFMIYKMSFLKIQNIYITGNELLNDNDIITMAELSEYPSFMLTSKKDIINKLKENNYIKSVSVKKTYNLKLFIDIEEYKILGIDNYNKLILGNGDKIDNIDNISNVPVIINDIDESIYSNFIKKFNQVDKNVYMSISQIEYSPVNVDKERFLLYMNDDNYVYITLSKIKKLNKYYDIIKELDGNKGIIYLDSGDYVEVRA